MRDESKRVYRRQAEAAVTGADGERRGARGAVTGLKGQAGTLAPGERHGSGLLESPLLVFTGWAEGARAGDVLEQGGQRYTILKVEDLAVGGIKVAARLTLERQVADHDSP